MPQHVLLVQMFVADGKIYGLAFDWIANVIYAVSLRCQVIACSSTRFRCATVISGQANVDGIAVHPIHGYVRGYD